MLKVSNKINSVGNKFKFTFESKANVAYVGYPLEIIWNDIEIDEKAREQNCRYCRYGTLCVWNNKICFLFFNQLCKSFKRQNKTKNLQEKLRSQRSFQRLSKDLNFEPPVT